MTRPHACARRRPRLVPARRIDDVLGEALSQPVARFDDRIVEHSLEVEHDLVVQTDPAAWGQVITNLVANSVLHGFVEMVQGGAIAVSASRIGLDRVRVVYRDNGRGLCAQARGRLGLRATREIVRERLHGTITLLDDDDDDGAGGAAYAIEFPTRPPR